MRYFVRDIWYPTLSILLVMILVCSCSEEQEQAIVSDGEMVKIGLNLRSIGAVEEDETINTVRILQIDNIAGKILTNTFISDVTENPLMVELVSGRSQIYVVVNEAVSAGTENSYLRNVTTYAELKQVALGPYNYSYNYNYNPFGSNIPMFGSVIDVRIYPSSTEPQSSTNPGTVSINGVTSGNILPVSLERLVCKLKLHMKLMQNGHLVDPNRYRIFFNLPQNIPLFEDYEGGRDKFDYEFHNRFINYDTNGNVLDYYYNEYVYYLPAIEFTPRNNIYNAASLAITTNGYYKNFVSFGHNLDNSQGELDYTLHRNHSYLLTVTADKEQKIVLLMEWDHEEVEAPIFGGQLNVPDKVIMDKELRNGSYTAEVYYTAEQNGYTGYAAPIRVWVGDQEITTTGQDYELPGRPDWLSVATLNQSSRFDYGSFTFTYQETTEQHPDYVITFRCGNIVKEMRVVYEQE